LVTRRSPQAERIIGIINYLTVNPSDDGVTIAEIARRLGVNKATCYPMLEALTEAGFLLRDPSRKTFNLGPAMIAAGNVAAKKDPRRELARRTMLDMADELNLTCWLVSADDTHLRVIDQAWRSRRPIPMMRVGERVRMSPPLGSVFMAWAGQRRVERWLHEGLVPDAEYPLYLERMAGIRAAGYAVSLEEPTREYRVLAKQLSATTTPAERALLRDQLTPDCTLGSHWLLTELEMDREYLATSIDAPIFYGTGQVGLAIGVMMLPVLPGRDILKLGERVSAAARYISES